MSWLSGFLLGLGSMLLLWVALESLATAWVESTEALSEEASQGRRSVLRTGWALAAFLMGCGALLGLH